MINNNKEAKMKKSLLATVIAGTFVLTACGSEEPKKVETPVTKNAVKETKSDKSVVLETKSDKSVAPAKKDVELPKVEMPLKKAPMASKEIELIKKDVLSEKKGSQDKLAEILLSEKEKGLAFSKKSKEEVDALEGLKKKEYEMQLKELEEAFSKVEVYVSDKYIDTKKQSFYISEFVVAPGVAFGEVQFDDQSKEKYFVFKSDDKWSIYETKADKEAREKKLKAYLESLKKKESAKKDVEKK